MADSALIGELATAAASVVAAGLVLIGKRRGNDPTEQQAVSLTKQLMSDQRRDLDRGRRRVAELERENTRLRVERDQEAQAHRAEVDQLREELDYAHARIAQIGGP